MKANAQMIYLTELDSNYSQQLQFSYDQRTTISDLIRFLREKIDQGSDYKIYLPNQPQPFNKDKSFYVFQLLQNNQIVRYQKVQKQGTQYSANSLQNLQRSSNSFHTSSTSQQQDRSIQQTNSSNYFSQNPQVPGNVGQKNSNTTQCQNCKELEKQIKTLNIQLDKDSKQQLFQIKTLQKEQVELLRQKDFYETEIFNQKEEVKSKIDTITSLKKQYEEQISNKQGIINGLTKEKQQQIEIINQLTKEKHEQIEIINCLIKEKKEQTEIINRLAKQKQEQGEIINSFNQKLSQSNTITPSQIIQKSKVQQNNTNQSLIRSSLETSSLQTINYLKLKCGHQQDMRELEQIVQQSTYSKQAPKCKMCKQNLSPIDLKQLGNLGDQYIMIINETNLGNLFSNLKKLKLTLGKCSNNQCSFFCIQQQQNRLPQNNTYCPSCLSNTVNLCKRN